MMSQMMQMMKECCGEDGMPDFDKMRSFMQTCGKTEFTDEELQMMQKFCAQSDNPPDAEQMKQLMAKCGC